MGSTSILRDPAFFLVVQYFYFLEHCISCKICCLVEMVGFCLTKLKRWVRFLEQNTLLSQTLENSRHFNSCLAVSPIAEPYPRVTTLVSWPSPFYIGEKCIHPFGPSSSMFFSLSTLETKPIQGAGQALESPSRSLLWFGF